MTSSNEHVVLTGEGAEHSIYMEDPSAVLEIATQVRELAMLIDAELKQ
jgi:hypothetical protein